MELQKKKIIKGKAQETLQEQEKQLEVSVKQVIKIGNLILCGSTVNIYVVYCDFTKNGDIIIHKFGN